MKNFPIELKTIHKRRIFPMFTLAKRYIGMPRAKANNTQLLLNEITSGYPGLTSTAGANLLEACVVTLTKAGHQPGIKLTLKGDNKQEIVLNWDKKCTPQMLRTWQDQDEATELAAVCISLLVILKTTNYTIIERSVKRTGFDYWLGEIKNEQLNIFTRKKRLEISGIFNGDDTKLEARVAIKLKQTMQSDSTMTTAIVSVIEFSSPKCKIVSRK